MFQASKKIFLVSSCALTLSAIACTPIVAQRGNLLEDHQMQQITVLESTRSDVLRNLGSPTTKSTFDSNVWYYIGQETEKRGILDPEVTNERIIVVAFNEEGFVDAMEEIDRERLDIPYVREKTPTHGNETTVMQQFLGNLGNGLRMIPVFFYRSSADYSQILHLLQVVEYRFHQAVDDMYVGGIGTVIDEW